MRVLFQRLYLGLLSFVIAETLAGSSPVWIFNPFAYFGTFPLYLLHFLFFVTLAIKTGKTSLKHLYLWGMLFGLYETWITKVIWAGYQHGGEFSMGSIMGFGIHETIVLVLFWHPLFAFIVPLLVGMKLMDDDEMDIFPDLNWLLSNDKFPKFLRIFTYMAGALTLAANTGDIVTSLITSIPGIVLLYLGYLILFKKHDWDDHTRLDVLDLGKRGMVILTILISLLYVIFYTQLLAEDIPGTFQHVVTVVLYVIILMVIKKMEIRDMPEVEETISSKMLFFILVIISITAAILTLIPFAYTVFIVVIISEIPVAIACAAVFLRR